MRLMRYELGGQARIGVVRDDRVVPTEWQSFDEVFAQPDPLASVLGQQLEAAPVRPEKRLAPVAHRVQAFEVGLNYAEHAAEIGEELQKLHAPKSGSMPWFHSFLWGAIIGPDDEIILPTPETQLIYEVEFALVIGLKARHLTEENAMDCVFGYTIVNDVGAREMFPPNPFQPLLGKNSDTFLPIGPWVVTKDEIPDPYSLPLKSYLNGEERQSFSTSKMLYTLPRMLHLLTRYITLHPGDIVATGSPPGGGAFRNPPEYAQPGDTVGVEVGGIGKMTNRVVKGW